MMAFQGPRANRVYPSRQSTPETGRAFVFLLFAGLLLGGAGERYIVSEFLLAIAAAVILTMTAWKGALRIGPSARRLLVLGGFWVALAVFSLVPVPPFLWQAASQGNAAEPVLNALGIVGDWRAMGLDPDRAVLTFLSIPLPLAGFWLTYSSTAARSDQAVRIVLLVSAASALLACLQFGSGGLSSLYLFATGHQGAGTGLYINRNHLALLLLVTMPFLATSQAIPAQWQGRTGARALRVTALVWLSLGVLATVSRTAVVLLLPTLVVTGLQMADGATLKKVWARVLAGVGIAGLIASQMPVARTIIERFAILSGDFRYLYWDNSLDLLALHFPFGAGPGSFARLYASVEPLTQVRPEFVGHAHNDWLEVALEFGLPGVACLAVLVFLVLAMARQAIARTSTGTRPLVVATLSGLILTAAFSAVDYPLRMPAIAFMASILLGLLARSADGETSVAIRPLSRFGRIAVPAAGICVVLALSTSLVARQLVRSGLGHAAATVAPWSGAALSARAQLRASEGDWAGAGDDARAALARLPLDPQAARILAGSLVEGGKVADGIAWLSLAASMGWRDQATQEWISQEALRSGQVDIAAERIDALLREGVQDELYYRQLGRMVSAPGGIVAIANRLEEKPGWARGFFNALASAPPPSHDLLTLLLELRKRSAPASVQDTALLRWALWERSQFQDVARLWRASGGSALLGDERFAELDGELPHAAAPYAWSSPRQPGTNVVAVVDGAKDVTKALEIASDGNVMGAVLQQSLPLEPGAYTVRVEAIGKVTLPLRLSLTCYDTKIGRWSEAGTALANRQDARRDAGLASDFVIDAACPAQMLTIAIAQATGQEGHVAIRKVEISKVAIDTAGSGRALDLR